MTMSEYSEKLKDPRWQKKRLEVLNAANFRCQMCGTDSKTLHVHHPVYERGKEPWEYSNLVALCEGCHKEIQDLVNYVSEFACLLPMSTIRPVLTALGWALGASPPGATASQVLVTAFLDNCSRIASWAIESMPEEQKNHHGMRVVSINGDLLAEIYSNERAS